MTLGGVNAGREGSMELLGFAVVISFVVSFYFLNHVNVSLLIKLKIDF